MALILGGVAYQVPGLDVRSWRDDPRIPQATDFNPRREPIKAIVVHTTSGRRGSVAPLVPGTSLPEADIAYARYQATTPDHKSWDFTVDRDGSIAQSNDPIERVTWHAGNTPVNNRSIGIEMVQDRTTGTIYQPTIDATVRLINWLTARLGIQRQFPAVNGHPNGSNIPRLLSGGGRDFYGIYGHRNTAINRGWGDPGDPIFDALARQGYEGFDLDQGQDLLVWYQRQLMYGVSPADGIPGPSTVAALRAAGIPNGIWVQTPEERAAAAIARRGSAAPSAASRGPDSVLWLGVAMFFGAAGIAAGYVASRRMKRGAAARRGSGGSSMFSRRTV